MEYIFTDEYRNVIEVKTAAELAQFYLSHLEKEKGEILHTYTKVARPTPPTEI